MLAFSSLFWSEDGLDGVLALFLLNSGHPAPRQQSTEHMLRRRRHSSSSPSSEIMVPRPLQIPVGKTRLFPFLFYFWLHDARSARVPR